ncbi:MAG: acyltransferase [Bacteroidales bacterium]|nr:acyltransferase [Bacteroidales bacterium]
MLTNDNLLSKAQSETISLLRFPMALLVILIHNNSQYYYDWHSELDLMSFEGACFLLGHILRLFAGIAVPTFFMISGFLFFNNFREFSWDGYKKKMKSRVKTLIIPYLLWNIAVWAALLAVRIVKMYYIGETWDFVLNFIAEKNICFLWDINHWGDANRPWLWWTTYATGPIDLPLWFLRDLIVVTVLSPLIYWFVKNLTIFSIVILFAAYVMSFWITWHGFSCTAFFYFTLGAYFAINGKNFVEFCGRYKTAILTAMAVFFTLTITRWITDDYKSIVRNLFYVSTVLTAVYTASYFVTNKGVKANPLLVSSCFFIYASHAAALPKSPLWLVQKVFNFIIPGGGYFHQIICYVVVPCVTAAGLVFAYWLLMKWLPKIGKVFCGGR